MIRTATLAAIGVTATLSAHADCTPIRFPPGASSATLQGRAPADTPFPCYIFNGAAGKTATVRIIRPSQGVAFNIAGVTENRGNISFKTDPRPYLIDVYDMGRGGSTPFTMEVAVR